MVGVSPAADTDVFFSSRALADYRAMFGLTDAELRRRRILDCPGGASSFGAEVRRLGGAVLSVDPRYAEPVEELRARADADLNRLRHHAEREFRDVALGHAGGIDGIVADWRRAAAVFAADFAANPAGYRVGALPSVPLPSGTFDLVLCSHLLFSYPDLFDGDGLVGSILELVRLASDTGEVRIYPLVDNSGRRDPGLTGLRARLADRGVWTSVDPIGRYLHPAATAMLRCGRGPGVRP